MGLEARIWASRLGFEGGTEKKEEEEEGKKEREKIPHMKSATKSNLQKILIKPVFYK